MSYFLRNVSPEFHWPEHLALRIPVFNLVSTSVYDEYFLHVDSVSLSTFTNLIGICYCREYLESTAASCCMNTGCWIQFPTEKSHRWDVSQSHMPLSQISMLINDTQIFLYNKLINEVKWWNPKCCSHQYMRQFTMGMLNINWNKLF